MRQTTTVTEGLTFSAWLILVFAIVLMISGLYAGMVDIVGAGALLFIVFFGSLSGTHGVIGAVVALAFLLLLGTA